MLPSVQKSECSYFHYLPSVKTTAITLAVMAIVGLGAYLALSSPSFSLSIPSLSLKNIMLAGTAIGAAYIFQKILQSQNKIVSYESLTEVEKKIFEGTAIDFEIYKYFDNNDPVRAFAKMVYPPQEVKDLPSPFISAYMAKRIMIRYDFNENLLIHILQGIGDDYDRIAEILLLFKEGDSMAAAEPLILLIGGQKMHSEIWPRIGALAASESLKNSARVMTH